MKGFESSQERSPISRGVEVLRGTENVLQCEVAYRTATLYVRKTPDSIIRVSGIYNGFGVPDYSSLPEGLKRTIEKAFSDFEETVAESK